MELDRIHFYVTDANRTKDLLIRQLGLKSLGEQINEQTIEYLVGNTHLLFVISAPLNSASPVAEYLQRHPSGVKDISFRVANLDQIARRVNQLGIEIVETSAVGVKLPWLKIRGWGDVDHTISQSPSVVAQSTIDRADRIIGIDHLVLNVGVGELTPATIWYQDLFDFRVQQTFDIQTQKSGLTSKALVSSCGRIRFNINEPSSGNSQIQDFIDRNHGAGIQHIALQTNDIFPTIERMRQQQLAFLEIDPTYYSQLQIRARTAQNSALTATEWHQLENLQILADWSESNSEAVLLQIFTQPIFESPTFFFEIIERRNRAKGFGQGNFQALFEAIEQNLAA
ncbi:MAG: 4-hydroxyphenylpyruvate dioxygenase [Chamaesiphon sp.]|nr:4-hydroxyphenylpyruvate dioxygenase [Chamaesiphon sp.]